MYWDLWRKYSKGVWPSGWSEDQVREQVLINYVSSVNVGPQKAFNVEEMRRTPAWRLWLLHGTMSEQELPLFMLDASGMGDDPAQSRRAVRGRTSRPPSARTRCRAPCVRDV